MRTQPSPDMRTGPGRGPSAIMTMESSKKPLSSTAIRSVQDLSGLDADIATAEEYERFLALKCYRVRKLILNLKAKRDSLDELGAVLDERRAA